MAVKGSRPSGRVRIVRNISRPPEKCPDCSALVKKYKELESTIRHKCEGCEYFFIEYKPEKP